MTRTTIKTKLVLTVEMLNTFQSGNCCCSFSECLPAALRVYLAWRTPSPPQGLLHLSCDTTFPTIYTLLFATVQAGKPRPFLEKKKQMLHLLPLTSYITVTKSWPVNIVTAPHSASERAGVARQRRLCLPSPAASDITDVFRCSQGVYNKSLHMNKAALRAI